MLKISTLPLHLRKLGLFGPNVLKFLNGRFPTRKKFSHIITIAQNLMGGEKSNCSPCPPHKDVNQSTSRGSKTCIRLVND